MPKFSNMREIPFGFNRFFKPQSGRSSLGFTLATAAGLLAFTACSELSQDTVIQTQAVDQNRTFELPKQPQGEPVVITVPKADESLADANARRRGGGSERVRFNIQLEFLTPVTAAQEQVSGSMLLDGSKSLSKMYPILQVQFPQLSALFL